MRNWKKVIGVASAAAMTAAMMTAAMTRMTTAMTIRMTTRTIPTSRITANNVFVQKKSASAQKCVQTALVRRERRRGTGKRTENRKFFFTGSLFSVAKSGK